MSEYGSLDYSHYSCCFKAFTVVLLYMLSIMDQLLFIEHDLTPHGDRVNEFNLICSQTTRGRAG